MSAAVSDTPKTDAFEAIFDRPMNWWDFARELERENADLRQTLADMPTCRCGLSTDEQCALSVENAALRKELEYTIKTGAKREADLLVMLGKETQP